MPPKSKNIKPVDNSNLNGSRIVIEKVPRKSRKSLKSEEGDKVEKTPSVIENISNPKKKLLILNLKKKLWRRIAKRESKTSSACLTAALLKAFMIAVS